MNSGPSERTCPGCGSPRRALIVYGRIDRTVEMRARIEEGAVVPGGSCVTGNDPGWRCLDCRRGWGLSQQTRGWVERAEPRPTPPEWLRLARHRLLLALGSGLVLATDRWGAGWLAVPVLFAWFGPFLIPGAAKHFALLLLCAVAVQPLPRGGRPSVFCVWFAVSSLIEFAALLCCLTALSSRLLG